MKRYSITQRHKARGIKTWYGRISDPDCGSVQYVSLGTELKKEAMAWRNRMIADSLSGNDRSDEGIPVEDSIEMYLKSFSGTELTRVNYESSFKRLKEWFKDNKIKVLGDLTPVVATRFINSIEDWVGSTKHRRLVIYRMWCAWVMNTYEPGWKKNPFSVVKVKVEKKRPRDFWTIEQVEEIIAACDDKFRKLMYAIMAFAGLRYFEFAKLSLDDLFDDEGNVKAEMRVVGKGGKIAYVPICDRLKAQILTTYNTPTKGESFQEFWRAAKGKNIPILITTNHTQNTLLKALFQRNKNLALIGGVVHLHRFRHSFISNLIRANVNIRCVADLARHENVMITLNTYSHLLKSDKTEALKIFSTTATKEV